MANHASSKKRVKRNDRRAVVNKARVSRIRTSIKKVDQAVESGDAQKAQEALKDAQIEMYRGVAKGILKMNTVARKLSRLVKRVKAA